MLTWRLPGFMNLQLVSRVCLGNAVAQWKSVIYQRTRLLVQVSHEALYCVLEQKIIIP